MSIALKAGVGAQLGKGGTVKLSELNSTDARSRTWSNADHYKRVNSNEIAAGDAPAPAASGTGTLSHWEGYEQFNDEDDRGSNMNISALDHDSVTFTWDRPAGYTSFAGNGSAGSMSDVKQEFFVKECASQTTWDACEDENPINATYLQQDNIDTNTATATGLDDETWYIGTVRMSWNDRNDTGGTYYHVGGTTTPYRGYLAVSAPAETNTERDSVNHDAIIFKTTVAPVCNGLSIGVSTISGYPTYTWQGSNGACLACCDRADSPINVEIDDTGLGNGVILYQDGTTCSAVGQRLHYAGTNYAWASSDTDTAYQVSNSVLTGTTFDCQNAMFHEDCLC